MSFLTVDNLQVSYKREDKKRAYAVQGVNIALEKRETLGIIGETGAGKTSTALAIMGLLPSRGRVDAGSVELDGTELIGLNDVSMRSIRGAKMAMIFQNPMSSLNPTINIERQIAEGILLHNAEKQSRERISARVDELLTLVGINPIMKRSYPHELSGGMRQRIGIAIALSCNPELLIADEPTSALDVTIQAQVLALMNDLKARMEMSMILITHDFGIVARMCDKVAVMYAGELMEFGMVKDVLTRPRHPYTQGLQDSFPSLKGENPKLLSIPGFLPDLSKDIPGCVFAPRCAHATERCRREKPPMTKTSEAGQAACWLCVGDENGK